MFVAHYERYVLNLQIADNYGCYEVKKSHQIRVCYLPIEKGFVHFSFFNVYVWADIG